MFLEKERGELSDRGGGKGERFVIWKPGKPRPCFQRARGGGEIDSIVHGIIIAEA